MKPAPLLLFFPLLFPVGVLAARPLTKPELRADGRYEFKDRGRPTMFRIATDELQQSGRAGIKRIPVTARDQLRQIQQAAKDLSGADRKYDLIAYPEGKPQTEANRRVVTHRVNVTLDEGIDPTTIGLAIKAKGMKAVAYLPHDYILEFADASDAITSALALQSIPGVFKANVMLGEKVIPAFLPNDPFFSSGGSGFFNFIGTDYAEGPANMGNPPPIYIPAGGTRAYQWYLNALASSVQTPPVLFSVYEEKDLPPFVDPVPDKNYPRYFEEIVDLNVIRAWDLKTRGGALIDGTDVRVGTVDDGAQLNPIHPDLYNTNMLLNDDRNFLDGDQSASSVDPKRFDPTPPFAGGSAPNHGTSTAGLILAKRDNTKGISGIAPDAKLAAYRVVGGFVDPGVFADSLVWSGERVPTQVTVDNPFGLPTGNEWRRGVIKFDISNNGWSYNSRGDDLIPMDLFLRKAMTFGVTEGRAQEGTAAGVIYVVPAGNDGRDQGNVNYSGQTNSIYTLTVGSISDLGRRVSYSAPGAALHVVTPSSGGEMAPRLLVGGVLKPATIPPAVPESIVDRALGYTVSTSDYDAPVADLRNTQQVISLNTPTTSTGIAGYNNNFGGTSASCAMATGVVALMLEANPKLGWRDVQEIMMRSARVIDPMMGEWQYNALGMPMSHKYGAGLVDAEHAVRMAKVWHNLGPRYGPIGSLVGTIDYKEVKGDSKKPAANFLIPDNVFTAPVKSTVSIQVDPPAAGMRVEHVVVRLKISHGRRGDLGVVLSSPKSGQADRPVESYLMVPHRADYNADIGLPDEPNGGTDRDVLEGEYWDFTSVRHWGTTSNQNAPLNGDVGNNNGQWTLTIWDNTKTGAVTGAASTPPLKLDALNPEQHVYVPVGNPTTPQRIKYVEVMYHGTTAPSTNEPPLITTFSLAGQTGKPFQATIRTVTDLQVDPADNSQRAPILDYRVRVLGTLSANTPELLIAPSTAEEYRLAFPPPTPPVSPASLRFDRATGLLTNAPYPGLLPGDPPPADIPPFKPLIKATWQLELRATSIFGTTRRQVQLNIQDSLNDTTWRNLYFTGDELLDPAISGDNADPDFDGVPNLMEYGMGGLPRVSEPNLLPVQTVVGNNLVLTYQVDTSARGYVISPQVSNLLDPLTSWTDLPSTLKTTDGNFEVREAMVPIIAGTRQFVRLRIAAP